MKPSAAQFREFLRGRLSPADSKKIADWMANDPGSGDVLRTISTEDGFDADLAAARTAADTNAELAQAVETLDRALPTKPKFDSAQAVIALPGYKIVRELGRGGMGVVYEAIDEHLSRRVAIKVMLPELAANEQAKERFLREGRAAAAVKSDHVVVIYQVGQSSGTPFIVMEYLEGESLDDWRTERNEVSTEDVVRVARDTLTGLAAAHAKGLVHRDIKPSNLWVDNETGRIKVLDFGLTCGDTLGHRITHSGSIVGTPAYMAPEQFDGSNIDGRADLFSAGVVLYHVAAGRSPFHRSTVMATIAAMATEQPQPLKTAAPWLPKKLAAFIERLLAKDPGARFPDAKSALAALDAAVDRLPPESARSSPRRSEPEPEKGKSRHALLIFGVSLLLCVPTAILVYVLMMKGTSPVAEALTPATEKKEETPKGAVTWKERDERFEWKGAMKTRRVASLRWSGGDAILESVLIKAGKFRMGSEADDKDANDDEKPSHEVVIGSDFYLGKTPVTVAQFESFVNETGYKTEAERDGEGGWGYETEAGELMGRKKIYNWRNTGWDQTSDHPVVNVSWTDAKAFCNWLSERSGKNVRLASEAEYEYAIRGGTTTRYFTGDTPESLDGYANVSDVDAKRRFKMFTKAEFSDGYVFTAPAGKFLPNPFGLSDMSGNVWCWVEDCYDEKGYQSAPRDGSAHQGCSGKQKVMRGGAWTYDPKRCRAAYREFALPEHRHANLGFRVVISVK